MVFALRHQPLRALYLAVELAVTLFVRLPIWAIWYIPKSGRGRPDWSYRKSIMLSITRLTTIIGTVVSRAGPIKRDPDHRAIMQGEGIKGVWVPPVPELVVGGVEKWAEQGNIEAIQIPGYWYDRSGQDTPIETPARLGEKVVYVIHGGGFVGGTASPSAPGLWSVFTARVAGCHPSIRRGFAVEYRLTTGPPLERTHPFPTALIDALAGYTYLIQKIGFASEDIIVTGDSAGASVALALVRYLVETRADLSFSHVPLPAPPLGLALLSPYGDLGSSHDGKKSSQTVNLSSDFLLSLDSPVFVYLRQNYTHTLGFPKGANTNRYLSPASMHPDMEPISFKGFPKIFITYGDAEILYDQCRSLEKKMVADLGDENVFVHAVKDACHDVMLVTFWEPEYARSFEVFAKWLDSIIPTSHEVIRN